MLSQHCWLKYCSGFPLPIHQNCPPGITLGCAYGDVGVAKSQAGAGEELDTSVVLRSSITCKRKRIEINKKIKLRKNIPD